MSIFSMFKKIFSSGSDDAFGEGKTRQEIEVDKQQVKNYYQNKVLKENPIKLVNWTPIIAAVFQSIDVQNVIGDLREKYNNLDYKDLSAFFQDINNAADIIIDEMRKIYTNNLERGFNKLKLDDFDAIIKTSITFKSDIVKSIFKVISVSDGGGNEFNEAFNPSVNNLTSFCKFLSQIVYEYRRNPQVILRIIQKLLIQESRADDFIKDCYNINTFIQNFKNIPYNNISDSMKQDFLQTVNKFRMTYKENGVFEKLSILIQLEKMHNPNFNLGIIGFKG